MPERKWQMRRLGAGDYVCWSNNMARLWRFYRYQDGKIHGLDVKYEARDFWLAAWMPEAEVHLLDASPERLALAVFASVQGGLLLTQGLRSIEPLSAALDEALTALHAAAPGGRTYAIR